MINVAKIETVMYNETVENNVPFEFINNFVPPPFLEREPVGKGRLPIIFDMLYMYIVVKTKKGLYGTMLCDWNEFNICYTVLPGCNKTQSYV